ncbi:MAG: DUF512 domain-containing protein [Defluviitaleaceae bacterium]|nr:DUF512 domain-containing protein [Defluviitaleaceae bacterium]
MHKITDIETGSIAQELELQPGDKLLTINGQKIADVLDYRFIIAEEELLLEVEKPDGEIWELEIEKDEADDLGLVFETGLMDQPRACQNRCIFCFMDQLPEGMRSSLYFKDDDPRLSFLSGNYVTLTNLSTEEAQRIARYHLSPLHISVHAVDSALRCKMLNNPKADHLFEYLRLFNDASIAMHFQIVLCKGVNDGTALDETIGALLALGSKAASLSVVPVGLTRHREGLYPLAPFSQEDAVAVIRQVEKWQAKAMPLHGTSFVYCSDEWYIRAGVPMPAYDHYEDFPQLENGVGMWALFEQDFVQGSLLSKSPEKDEAIGIVTGTAAQRLMEKLVAKIPRSVKVYPVQNDFFGRTVTVSGLLTGQDVVGQVKEKAIQDGCVGLFLPRNMFRDGTECTLDDMTREEMESLLGMPVWIGDTNGGIFASQIMTI